MHLSFQQWESEIGGPQEPADQVARPFWKSSRLMRNPVSSETWMVSVERHPRLPSDLHMHTHVYIYTSAHTRVQTHRHTEAHTCIYQFNQVEVDEMLQQVKMLATKTDNFQSPDPW